MVYLPVEGILSLLRGLNQYPEDKPSEETLHYHYSSKGIPSAFISNRFKLQHQIGISLADKHLVARSI